jgi:hypothetical protein
MVDGSNTVCRDEKTQLLSSNDLPEIGSIGIHTHL